MLSFFSWFKSSFFKYFKYLIAGLGFLLPIVAFAAFNDVNLETEGVTVNLPDTNKNYTITRSTRVESFVVNGDNIEFTMQSGSVAEVSSADRHTLNVGSGCEIIDRVCNSSLSSVAVQCSSSITIKITPDRSTTCDNTGGRQSSGSGGGAAGGASQPSTKPKTDAAPEPARVVVNIGVDRPSAINVGSSSHTVTVLQATPQEITVRIASEPVTVSMKVGEIKEVDTNGDGKNDLSVRYVGWREGKPELEFIQLAAAPKAAEATPAIACALEVQKAYKRSGSSAVYYISESCTKRPFNNSRVFFTYFDRWSDVKSTSKATLDGIANDTLGFMPWGPKFDPQYGALVKIVSDPKVYLLLGEEKYWITNEEVFTKLGYQWNWIEDIDSRLLNKYLTGSEINYLNRHPNYTLVKYAKNSKVYRLEPDPADAGKQVRRHIKDEKTFRALKYRFDRIVTIANSETYADGAQLTAP